MSIAQNTLQTEQPPAFYSQGHYASDGGQVQSSQNSGFWQQKWMQQVELLTRKEESILQLKQIIEKQAKDLEVAKTTGEMTAK